jgi:SSS family solute:Na+ symporter
LIGGVIILQTLPAIVIGLYSRAAHAWGLLAGLLAGLAGGLYMLYDTPNAVTGKAHFGGAQYALSNFGMDTKVTLYTGLIAIVLNLVVTFVVTALVRMTGRGDLPDQTAAGDYDLEAGDPGVEPIELDEQEPAPLPAGRP